MCIFCMIASGEIKSNIVYENDKVISFLDLSQATKGHTLVVPKKHVTNVLDCDSQTLSDVSNAIIETSKILKEKLNINDMNILSNAGSKAGQTVMHMHFHLLPRYANDDLKIEFTEHGLNDEIIEKLTKRGE